jgi:hypothetical protein
MQLDHNGNTTTRISPRKGGTIAGGSTSHSHSVTIETGPPIGTSTVAGDLVDTATPNQTHSCSSTTRVLQIVIFVSNKFIKVDIQESGDFPTYMFMR